MLALDEVLMLSKDIVLRGVGDKYWALNTKNGNQYKLNEVSYFILDIYRQPKTIREMMNSVLTEYRIDKDCLEADCAVMIQSAIEKNILVKEV